MVIFPLITLKVTFWNDRSLEIPSLRDSDVYSKDELIALDPDVILRRIQAIQFTLQSMNISEEARKNIEKEQDRLEKIIHTQTKMKENTLNMFD